MFSFRCHIDFRNAKICISNDDSSCVVLPWFGGRKVVGFRVGERKARKIYITKSLVQVSFEL
jgi:hypothetical protein